MDQGFPIAAECNAKVGQGCIIIFRNWLVERWAWLESCLWVLCVFRGEGDDLVVVVFDNVVHS